MPEPTPREPADRRTAAALVIGNELLTGKIEERNVAVLARELFGLGISFRRVVVCPDEEEIIVRDLRSLADEHDYVFTSGGVGPTHDDVTMDSVARCFGRRLRRSRRLQALLEAYFRDRLTEGHLRMADVPEGADLISAGERDWPTVRLANVFVLPGLPEVFQLKMPTLRLHLEGGRPFVSRAVPTAADEGELADLLTTLAERFPDVAIGSYPQWGKGPVKVKVTFDARDRARVDRAAEALIAALPAGQLVMEEAEGGGEDDPALEVGS
ncbi:MAG: molybdopterin-binding protein [Holophagales bacterium]|nr:molybdopterin-binding protein [Holophagales bacterium]